MTTQDLFFQIADSVVLLPEVSAAVKGGKQVDVKDIVTSLVSGSRDCYAATWGDPSSTWNEKRISRACLVIAFLTALVWTQDNERGMADPLMPAG